MRDNSQKNNLFDTAPDEPKNEDSITPHPSYPPPPLYRQYIGRYEVIYPIAQGGMAGVYAGRLSGIAGFERLVAIKIVHSHLSSQERFIRMFLDEARLAARIHHSNVGEVIEVGEDNGLYYMVCELILGQSLRSFHRRASKRSVEVSSVHYARIISATGLALQAAHDLTDSNGEPLNLVHRDVSPRNILLTYDGNIKLIDFGIAYAQGRMSHTDTGTLKGKLGYMSPEQLRCQPIDNRSDVFSLGVVLYQMITGKQPFFGNSDIERFNKILAHQFKKPGELVAHLSPELESIILRAMAHAPEDRYASAAAMSRDLETFVKHSEESVDSASLSHLMHALFSEEHDYHLKKIRESREQGDSYKSRIDHKEISDPAKRTTIPARPISRRPSTGQSDIGRRPNRSFSSKLLVAALAAAVVLIFVLFKWVEGKNIEPIPTSRVETRAERPAPRHTPQTDADAFSSRGAPSSAPPAPIPESAAVNPSSGAVGKPDVPPRTKSSPPASAELSPSVRGIPPRPEVTSKKKATRRTKADAIRRPPAAASKRKKASLLAGSPYL